MTTATIKLLSSDIVSQGMSVNIDSALTKAGGVTDVTSFTGTILNTLPSASSPATLKIVDKTLFLDNKSAKVYIFNAETIATPDSYVIITLNAVVLGRLYPGDWCLIPYAGLVDVNATPKASTPVKIEHCVIGGL